MSKYRRSSTPTSFSFPSVSLFHYSAYRGRESGYRAMVYQSSEDFVAEMDHFLATDYTIMSGAVIWFYDILLTLDDEASLLWTRGGRFIKALYLTVIILSPTAILAYLLTYSQCRIGIFPSWVYPWSSRVSELVLDQL
jgi:hypothetical protein